MNPAKIAISKIGATTVLAPKESVTYQNCAELETAFQGVLSASQSLVLDCGSVSYLDSMALELLCRIQERLKERGSELKIVGLNGVCRDILVATRLINQFHVHKEMREAIGEAS